MYKLVKIIIVKTVGLILAITGLVLFHWSWTLGPKLQSLGIMVGGIICLFPAVIGIVLIVTPYDKLWKESEIDPVMAGL